MPGDTVNVRGANLANANLRFARAVFGFFGKANMRGADLQRADLQNANLQQASFFGADLQGADLTGANLQGVNLSLALNLTDEQVARACVDELTRLPMGLELPLVGANCELHGDIFQAPRFGPRDPL